MENSANQEKAFVKRFVPVHTEQPLTLISSIAILLTNINQTVQKSYTNDLKMNIK
jgi:hypothetical protein